MAAVTEDNRLQAHPFAVALQLVLRWPRLHQGEVSPAVQGQALSWVPLVALLLGGGLWLTAWLFSGVPAEVTAVLVLLVWIKLTGALTIESLAEVADAVLSRDPQAMRSLLTAVPGSGAGMAMMLGVLLLLWALLVQIIRQDWTLVLLVLPVVGWMSGLMVMLGSRWVKDQRLQAGWRAHARMSWLLPQLLLLMTGMALASGWTLTLLVVATWAWIVWWRKQLGGVTDEVVLSWVLISEVLWLLGLLMALI